MRAANELKPEERPAVTNFMPQDEYNAAKEQLHQVDAKIPGDVVEKAIQLFFSTNLLPDYDLSTCYVRELPKHQHACTHHAIYHPSVASPCRLLLVINIAHTWALCHGTTLQFRSTDPLGG